MAAPETGLSVVTDAFLMAGIVGQGQTVNNADLNLGLRRLNGMISGWQTKRWLIWHLLEMGVTANGRTTPYLIGPGAADFNVARRPDRIENAFVRQVFQGALPVDTPMQVWQSKEQYNQNSLKQSFVSYPAGLFLDSTWPIGLIYCYPWPTASLYQIFIAVKDVLPVFTATTLLSSIPDQYLEAIKTNLARLLRQNYGKGTRPDPELNAISKNALNTLKNSNIQVPDLTYPIGLSNRGNYNIYSDGQK